MASLGLAAEIAAGLCAAQANVSPKYFHDAAGSELFERITRLPEDYLSRAEAAIIEAHGEDMARQIGAGTAVIELGAGNCEKARALCELIGPSCFVAIDISAHHAPHEQSGRAVTKADAPVDAAEKGDDHCRIGRKRHGRQRPRLGGQLPGQHRASDERDQPAIAEPQRERNGRGRLRRRDVVHDPTLSMPLHGATVLDWFCFAAMSIRLVCPSKADEPQRGAPTDSTLCKVPARNTQNDVTGVLCPGQGVFLQVLEGERGKLTSPCARTHADPRHGNPELIHCESITEQRHGDWSMAHVRLSDADLPTKTRCRPLETGKRVEQVHEDLGMVG